MEYLAHSNNPERGTSEQSYADHVGHVRALADAFAGEAAQYYRGDRDQLRQTVHDAALVHDLGKLEEENQRTLAGEGAQRHLPIDHVDAGAAQLMRCSRVLPACLVSAHHHGLPDLPSEINKGEQCFRDEEICRQTDGHLDDLCALHAQLVPGEILPASAAEQSPEHLSIWLRVALSCLVDADHTDTARSEGKSCPEASVPLRAAERLAALDEAMRKLEAAGREKRGKQAERNRLRAEMYGQCREAEPASAIVCCDSPVGSGKTTAVMGYLLRRAQREHLRRIFVVLPYTSIIDQSVKTYRRYLTLPGEDPQQVVAELHHRADFDSEETRKLTALWRAPIVVTTAVTFFETLASKTPSALRRLHELPGSAVFLDEAHAALPVHLWPLAWQWICSYAADWGVRWVLASGSLSRFWEIPEIAGESTQKVSELVPEGLRQRLQDFESGRIDYPLLSGELEAEELIDRVLKEPGPRLVIVNTVQNAAVIARLMGERCGRAAVEHLSTALIPGDREAAIRRVRKRLEDSTDTDWTLVATSCVEAGMEFSFRTGFRELCSLTSLLQSAGRINRSAERDTACMYTFRLRESDRLNSNPAVRNSRQVLMQFFEKEKMIAPALTTESIRRELLLYGAPGGKDLQRLTREEEGLCFPAVEKDFQVIESASAPAVVTQDAADRVRRGQMDWQELQTCAVQISRSLLRREKVEEIADGIYFWDRGYDSFVGYMAGVLGV